MRVGDRHRLEAGRERAVGDHAGLVGGGDDGAGGLGPELGRRVGGRPAVGGGDVPRISVGPGRPPQSSSSSTTRAMAIALSASRRRPSAIGPAGRGDPDPLADDDAQVDRDVRLGHVLVDLAVGEPGQRRVLGRDQRLGLGDAVAHRERQRGLGQGERVAASIVVHRLAPAYHLPTPTWTSRNRAPGTAWPTWPVWPGSPLPQFGVPSIT